MWDKEKDSSAFVFLFFYFIWLHALILKYGKEKNNEKQTKSNFSVFFLSAIWLITSMRQTNEHLSIVTYQVFVYLFSLFSSSLINRKNKKKERERERERGRKRRKGIRTGASL